MQPTRWPGAMTSSRHVYEIRPRKDRRGFDLIGDRLPLGPLWFEGPEGIGNAVNYAKFCSRSHPVIIRVFEGLCLFRTCRDDSAISVAAYARSFHRPRVTFAKALARARARELLGTGGRPDAESPFPAPEEF